MKKIFLFDCDQTIWTSHNNDYISSVTSPLVLVSKNTAQRVVDGKKFILKPEINLLFRLIQGSGDIIGIVSDNSKDMVVCVLRLFDIYKFVNPKAVNVRLWSGYCPKHKMIVEILKKTEFKEIPTKNVYWFDDKDYKSEAKLIGVNFIYVNDSTSLVDKTKEILSGLE